MTDSSVLYDELWDYNDPEATEKKFRELLPTLEEGSGERAELITQIARTLSLQRRFDEAHALLDTLEPDLAKYPPVVKCRYLLERGRTYNSSKRREAARALFIEAWTESVAHAHDFYAVDAAHMVAIAETGQGALDWNIKALERAEASSDPLARRWLGSLYNNIGWTHHDAGRYEDALAMFEKALAFRMAQGNEEGIRIARWCVARAMRSLGQIDEALKEQHDLMAKYEAEGHSGGYVYEEIAECLLELGRTDEATPYFARAYEVLHKDEWLVDMEPERIARLKELGDVK